MVARLWWKDLRQFGPIWTLIAVLALAFQPLLLRYGDATFRNGALAAAALGWTCLYAYAVAAAAFAGERESRTLAWLDALPADRKTVWLAKASFALASTAALGLVLLAVAAVSTEQWPDPGPVQGVLLGALVALAILGCGLFWSAVLDNALLAAVLSLATSLMGLPLLQSWLWPRTDLRSNAPAILAVGAIAWLASWLLFVSQAPPRLTGLPGRRRSTSSQQLRSAATSEGAARRASHWGPAARSLAWQTGREARALLGWLLLLGVALPLVLELLVGRPVDVAVWVLAVLLVSLAAGVSAFGNDLRRGSNRMLANHGVRPSLVWVVRVAVWLAVVVALAALAFGLRFAAAMLGASRPFQAEEGAGMIAAGALAFSMPVLCGMVFRRGITAGVVAILLSFLISIPVATLFFLSMLPPVFVLLVVLAILGVSLCWSGDWLVEQPGAGRWRRLAGWCLGISGILFAAYASARVFAVPQLDPASEARRLDLSTHRVPDDQNAAPLYRKAVATLSPMPAGVAERHASSKAPLDATQSEWLAKNQQALALFRQAAAKPVCRFTDLGKETVFDGQGFPPQMHLVPGLLLELSVHDRIARGDLDGAWKDIETCFRLARHRMSNAPIWQAVGGLFDERRALRLAMAWASDGRQTAARLRSALAAIQSLPAADGTEPIRVEARLLRNTEELPRAVLREKSRQMHADRGKHVPTAEALRVDLMTTPWERARFRRAWRVVLSWAVEQAQREPWMAATSTPGSSPPRFGPWVYWSASPLVEWIMQTTPLLHKILPPLDTYLIQWDRNEVGRRALVQILALRAWQITHDGGLPEKLEELVTSGELDRLPTDPFTPRRLFGYVPARGQGLLPLDDPGILDPGIRVRRPRPVEPGRLLYSVGPDRQDDQAVRNDELPMGGDIVFPLREP